MNFAKFFAMNASALKVMRFDVDTDKGDRWCRRKLKPFQLVDLASAEVQFHFNDIGMNLMDNVHLIHDLSVPDPFAKSMEWRSFCL